MSYLCGFFGPQSHIDKSKITWKNLKLLYKPLFSCRASKKSQKYNEFNVIRTFPWVFIDILKKFALFNAFEKMLQNLTFWTLLEFKI